MTEISNNQIKNIARRLFSLDKSITFSIADKDERYALLRQEGCYGMAHNYLRGSVINYVSQSIVCGPSDYIVECTQSVLFSPNGDDLIVIPDSTQKPQELPLADIEARYGIEGTNILLWLDDDLRVRLTSHRKLDCDKAQSSYAASQPYFEYLKMGGVDTTKFFRPNIASRVVHRLIIQYADLAPCCKRNSEGNICYDGFFIEQRRVFAQGQKVDTVPVPITEIFTHSTANLSQVINTVEPTVFIATNEISISDANTFLAMGYYPASPSIYGRDMRTLTGEFVYIVHLTTRNTYRIKSFAWKWRFDHIYYPNIIQNAYETYSYATNIHQYNAAGFPTMTYQNDAALYHFIKNGVPIVELDRTGPIVDISTYNGRLYNIMLCLLLSTRVSKQSSVFMAMSQYLTGCHSLGLDILSIEKEKVPEIHPRLHNDLLERSSAILKKVKPPTTAHILEGYLRTIPGSEIYALVRDFIKLRIQEKEAKNPTRIE